MEIKFTIEGIPIGKGRPRFFRKGNFVGTYTPENTRSWEAVIRWYCRMHRPLTIPMGPAIIFLTFNMPRPKSLPKKTKHHVKKPDLDNMAKAVLDAMQGSFFHSDSQIVFMGIGKQYAEHPGVEVRFLEA